MSEQLDLSSDKGQVILDLTEKIYMAFRFGSVDNVMAALIMAAGGMLLTMENPARARNLFVDQLDRTLAFLTKYPESHPFINFRDVVEGAPPPAPDLSMTPDTAYTTLLLIRWRDAAEKMSADAMRGEELSVETIREFGMINAMLLKHAKTLGSVSS